MGVTIVREMMLFGSNQICEMILYRVDGRYTRPPNGLVQKIFAFQPCLLTSIRSLYDAVGREVKELAHQSKSLSAG